MTKSQRSLLVSSILLAIYWCMIFTATHMPMPTPAAAARAHIPHIDKVVHLGIYACLAFLLLWFFSHGKRSLRTAAVMTIGLVAGYGLLDEILQSFVPSRHADPLDFVADLIGGAVGVTAFVALRRWSILNQFWSRPATPAGSGAR